MESYLYWLSIVPILITVLLVHESGHLIAAKAFRVKTLEFGIGFPPRIAAFATGNTLVMISEQTQFIIDKEITEQIPKDLKKGALARITSIEQKDGTLVAHTIELRGKSGWRKGRLDNPPEHLGPPMYQRGRIRSATETEIRIADMEWSLNLIPFGAFVGLHEDRSQRSATALNSKPSWQRATVIIAGIAANLAFPIIPIFIATIIHTTPSYLQVTEVQPASPAEQAGIAPGDLIIAHQQPAVSNPAKHQGHSPNIGKRRPNHQHTWPTSKNSYDHDNTWDSGPTSADRYHRHTRQGRTMESKHDNVHPPKGGPQHQYALPGILFRDQLVVHRTKETRDGRHSRDSRTNRPSSRNLKPGRLPDRDGSPLREHRNRQHPPDSTPRRRQTCHARIREHQTRPAGQANKLR